MASISSFFNRQPLKGEKVLLNESTAAAFDGTAAVTDGTAAAAGTAFI